MKALKYCKKCKLYTMAESCPKCGQQAATPHPAKYSPQDKFARFRRAELLETI
ncbi:MAG: RNA-protein complex protein Nop10 [Candidatus Micrarchaeia archaeon]|jgi:H/ACA ribonucleoprotein complex subunit 3